jgi:hypothetical protein
VAEDSNGEWSHDLSRQIYDTIPRDLARKWSRTLARTNAIMDEIRKACPTAEVYMNESTANLLYGPSHEGRNVSDQQQRIVASVEMRHWDGGGW